MSTVKRKKCKEQCKGGRFIDSHPSGNGVSFFFPEVLAQDLHYALGAHSLHQALSIFPSQGVIGYLQKIDKLGSPEREYLLKGASHIRAGQYIDIGISYKMQLINKIKPGYQQHWPKKCGEELLCGRLPVRDTAGFVRTLSERARTGHQHQPAVACSIHNNDCHILSVFDRLK